jgi:photosystem II stability/assembly factor-like uncharacterized protein
MISILGFSEKEKTAITVSPDGLIEVWVPAEYKGEGKLSKIFTAKSGNKYVLVRDNGLWFKDAKEAAFCKYKQLWLGEYPYSSWAFCVRQDKSTGHATVEVVETEINGKSTTPSDRWEQDCMAYLPQS